MVRHIAQHSSRNMLCIVAYLLKGIKMLSGNATHNITNSVPRTSTMMLHCLYALPLDIALLISCLRISYCVETVDAETRLAVNMCQPSYYSARVA